MILILFQLFLDIYQEHLHIYSFLNKAKNRGCRISKYFCWAAALLSAQNGIEISYGSDAIL